MKLRVAHYVMQSSSNERNSRVSDSINVNKGLSMYIYVKNSSLTLRLLMAVKLCYQAEAKIVRF